MLLGKVSSFLQQDTVPLLCTGVNKHVDPCNQEGNVSRKRLTLRTAEERKDLDDTITLLSILSLEPTNGNYGFMKLIIMYCDFVCTKFIYIKKLSIDWRNEIL